MMAIRREGSNYPHLDPGDWLFSPAAFSGHALAYAVLEGRYWMDRSRTRAHAWLTGTLFSTR